MIDLNIYKQNKVTEEFLESLQIKLTKDHPPVKIYISTASQYNNWSQKLYIFYNNTKLTEVQNESK